MPDWSALCAWTREVAGLELADAQIAQLAAHLDILLFWNRRLALVSQRDPEVIVAKHVADSLFAAAHCAGAARIADLGSGAGFPGLPIAICWPDAWVILIESRGKKATFLEEAARAAHTRNLTVCNARIEVLAATDQHASQYGVVTARALTDLQRFADLARPFLAPDGRALAMRSSADRHGSAGPVPAEVISYQLPDGTPRRLMVFGPRR